MNGFPNEQERVLEIQKRTDEEDRQVFKKIMENPV
jgi:hypothetical protein